MKGNKVMEFLEKGGLYKKEQSCYINWSGCGGGNLNRVFRF